MSSAHNFSLGLSWESLLFMYKYLSNKYLLAFFFSSFISFLFFSNILAILHGGISHCLWFFIKTQHKVRTSRYITYIILKNKNISIPFFEFLSNCNGDFILKKTWLLYQISKILKDRQRIIIPIQLRNSHKKFKTKNLPGGRQSLLDKIRKKFA